MLISKLAHHMPRLRLHQLPNRLLAAKELAIENVRTVSQGRYEPLAQLRDRPLHVQFFAAAANA
jgi:hypothetical protein